MLSSDENDDWNVEDEKIANEEERRRLLWAV